MCAASRPAPHAYSQSYPIVTALACRALWKVYGDAAVRDLQRRLSQEVKREDGTNTAALASSVAHTTAELEASGGIIACGDINLEIKRGEFFVLMGLSGSGKSTLIRCMSRLTEPTAGRLELDGEDFLSIPPRQLRTIRQQKIGMVFQHFGLFPHMTVIENVAFPLRVQKMPVRDRKEKALEMIELVGLSGREEAYPNQLSGGQKQRVGIARSLAVDPQLWFLDEPFSALDPLIRWQMQSELLRLQTVFHKTIVFVTHDFMEAVRLADRIAIMKDGLIVQVGTPQEIVLSPATDYVAEFVKEAPRTRIIKISQLMEPEPARDVEGGALAAASDDGVNIDTTLEEALAWHAQRGGSFPVRDDAGHIVGIVTPERLAAALKAT